MAIRPLLLQHIRQHLRRHLRRIALTGLLAAAAQATLAGTVTVQFPAPEQYTDVHADGDVQVQVLQPLAQSLERLGSQLPADQRLSIEVTDIDLAGDWRPVGPQGQWMRVMTPVTWPRIVLRYRLGDASGHDLRSGEATLKDMDYQSSVDLLGHSEPLRYEKRLLRDWFEREFPPLHGSGMDPAWTQPRPRAQTG